MFPRTTLESLQVEEREQERGEKDPHECQTSKIDKTTYNDLPFDGCNSADDIRQAVKSITSCTQTDVKLTPKKITNDHNEEEHRDRNRDGPAAETESDQKERRSKQRPHVGKSRRRSRSRPVVSSRKRRTTRRVKTVPRKKMRYSRLSTSRKRQTAPKTRAKNKKNTPSGSEEGSDVLSISSPSSASGSSC